jgi:MYXO-CTERM domain-containing protein
MKTIMGICLILVLSGSFGIAQTSPVASDTNPSRNETDSRNEQNWGWIGLLGLAGLAGLGGRKSQQVRRLEQSGANVKSV